MKRRLFLAVMRPGMTFYAQHCPWQLMEESEFLELPHVKQTISNAKTFGYKVRLMEDDPNPKKPNTLVRDLV